MNKQNKVLIVNGSPRRSKNCSKIIENITKKLEENKINYEVLNIYRMNIDYCTACGYCERTGKCIIKDDMTPLYEAFDKSIGTIVVSPMFFQSISTKVKTLVDRTQAFYSSKYILKKPSIDIKKERRGMFIAVGGQPEYENQFLGGQLVMDLFFKCINTKLISNVYMSNSDEVAFSENMVFQEVLNEAVINYIKEINDLM
ncbi:flavodoxin family protein [Terrisporobacter glycolicus]|uniref:NADPH-dependent FMN reductase-like domain-containing protein n=1 Tax=Terrisporobacter glycolicus ATCC 14880 = DSM 1288 TaxID=1121315 RepID=A0ABZ2ESL9_9FIRM|nr:flavodoxin family protein [Terrisporobacter glycolicus]